MSDKKRQGFASLTPEQLKEVSSRGGQKKGRKGFASYSKEQRKLNSSRASKIRWDKVKAEREQTNDITTNDGDGQVS